MKDAKTPEAVPEWPADDVRLFNQLLKDGCDVRYIAHKLNRSVADVRDRFPSGRIRPL